MSQHIKEVAKVLIANGYTPVAAAGIIGNAYQESGWNPDAMEPASAGDGSDNGGLWGFTAAPHSLADVRAYAAQRGEKWDSPILQAQFMVHNIDPATKATLNSIKDPAKAAEYFMNTWEKPYVPSENLARRQQGASIAFKQISGDPMKATARGKAIGKSSTTANGRPSTSSVTTAGTAPPGLAELASLLAPVTNSAGYPVTTPEATPVSTSIPKLPAIVAK